MKRKTKNRLSFIMALSCAVLAIGVLVGVLVDSIWLFGLSLIGVFVTGIVGAIFKQP